tara:strand:+ start:746 stop:1375 length:630 start_codon:yes stop_codon:yes gene_type:complete
MTTATLSTDNSAVLAEFAGGQTTDVAMMIGIGLVKDSEAVFFQYLGEEQQPSALMMPSGKPLTRLSNIKLAGIDIAEGVGEFKSTKLNLFLESNQGRIIMLTSGLTTIWSQCVITALMGMFNSYDLETPFVLDSWKGNSKMRPCFAAVRIGQNKISDQMLYDQLAEARSDRDKVKQEQIMRDSIEILNHAVKPQAAEITVVTTTEEGEF